MTYRFYTMDVGENEAGGQVTEGEDAVAGDISIRIDLDTNYPSRIQVLNTIEYLKNFILTDNWPPA